MLDKKIIYYLDIAKKESQKSTYHKTHIGAVITQKNKIISRGYNKLRRHKYSRFSKHGCTLHAEVDAIINAPKGKLNGSTIYIYRELKDGSAGLSKPCKFCMASLVHKKLRRVVYSNNDNGYEIIKV